MRTTAAAVLFGFLYFLAGHAVLLARPNLAAEYFYSGPMAGAAHLFTLGWVSLLIAGVLRQLTPFGFQAELRRPRLAGLSVALWIPSIVLMTVGLWGSFPAFIATGVAGVFLGAM